MAIRELTLSGADDDDAKAQVEEYNERFERMGVSIKINNDGKYEFSAADATNKDAFMRTDIGVFFEVFGSNLVGLNLEGCSTIYGRSRERAGVQGKGRPRTAPSTSFDGNTQQTNPRTPVPAGEITPQVYQWLLSVEEWNLNGCDKLTLTGDMSEISPISTTVG